MQIKEVIVVEGKNDTKNLQSIFGNDIYTIETGGSALDSEKLALIKKAHEHRGVIVFTDPDYAGNKIRSQIRNAIPTVKHAFIEQLDGVSKNKKKIGIEHASKNSITIALSKVYTINNNNYSWKTSDLYDLGLIGRASSSKLRIYLSKNLSLGHVNAKQLLRRLNMFDISKDTVKGIIEKIT